MKPNLTDQGEKEVSCPTRVQGVQPQLSQQEPSCGGDDLLGQVSCDRLVPGQDKVHQRQGVLWAGCDPGLPPAFTGDVVPLCGDLIPLTGLF